MKKKWLRALSLLVLAGMVLALLGGCGGSKTITVAANPDRIKKVSGGYWPTPPGFGGNLSASQVGDPGYYIYESMFLVIVGTDKVIPRLAESWEHDEQTNTTTVKLHENRKWNDGTPFTAKDLYTYYLININDAALNQHLESITVKDDYTLEFKWVSPVLSETQRMLSLAEGWQAVTPYHLFGEIADEIEEIMKRGTPYEGERSRRPAFGLVFSEEDKQQLNDLYARHKEVVIEMPVGTGPYMVDKVTKTECQLKVNPHYPDGDKLEFQRIHMHTVSDYNSLLATAQTDSFIGMLPYDLTMSIVEQSKSMVMYPLMEYKSVGVVFNVAKKPFDDKRVRQAINMLINKKTIREVANYWGVENNYATTGLVISTLDKHIDADVLAKFDLYTGDAEKAAQMMEAAGWSKNSKGLWADPDGDTHKLTIACNAGWGAQGVTVAVEVAQQLTDFGIQTEAKSVDATVVVSNMKQGAYDMLVDFLDMTHNIADPYRCFNAYYGNITDMANLKYSLSKPLILQDYNGDDINITESIQKLRFMDDEAAYRELVGKISWATNDNAIGINLYQNVMAVWENMATSTGLPMEDEFDEHNRVMPLPRTEEELEAVSVLNRGYTPFAEVFIRNVVKPRNPTAESFELK